MVIPIEDERTNMQNYGCEMGVKWVWKSEGNSNVV